jgi:general nucleoside transport system permease protein
MSVTTPAAPVGKNSLARLVRDLTPRWGYPVAAVALSLVVSAGLMLVTGYDPLEAYTALYEGSLGSEFGLSVTLVRMTPLVLTGLAVALAFRAGVFNIGAEGQLYAGAIAATAVALVLPLPAAPLVLVAVVAGFAGGAAWALIPALLRATRGVSEVVVTLMFNFIAIHFTTYIVNLEYGPLGEREAAYPQSPLLAEGVRLPIIWTGTSVHAGLAIGVVLALALSIVVRYTPFGFRLRTVGANPDAARYAGVSVKRTIIVVMLLSGGLAGLAGMGEVLGTKYALYANFSPGYGYDGIAVALLARLSPIAVILFAAFFGAMRAGALDMEQTVGVSSSFVFVIEALAILFLVLGVFVQRGRRGGVEESPAATQAAAAEPRTT